MDGTEHCRQTSGKVWIGLDVHKANSMATAFDEGGKEIASWEFATNPNQVDAFVKELPNGAAIALEASTIGKAMFQRLRCAGVEVHMASPRELKAITGSDVKTDKRDSYHLGNLLRNNYFPECYVPFAEIERIRDLVRFRMGLGQQVSGVKNRIHALVSKNLLDSEMDEYTDMFGKAGLAKLITLPFPDNDRGLLKAYLEHLVLLVSQEERAMEALARIGKEKKEIELLMTIPGIDFYNGLGIFGEIGDAHRFPHKKKLYSYAGLVPKTDNSGEIQSRHRHVKRGNKVLKFFLCCAVHGTLRASKPNAVAKFYHKKAKQIGAAKAQVAAARKLCGIIWKILITGKTYIEEDPALTNRKLGRMEYKARVQRSPPSNEELMKLVETIGAREDVLKHMVYSCNVERDPLISLTPPFTGAPSPEGVAQLTPSGSGERINKMSSNIRRGRRCQQ